MRVTVPQSDVIIMNEEHPVRKSFYLKDIWHTSNCTSCGKLLMCCLYENQQNLSCYVNQ